MSQPLHAHSPSLVTIPLTASTAIPPPHPDPLEYPSVGVISLTPPSQYDNLNEDLIGNKDGGRNESQPKRNTSFSNQEKECTETIPKTLPQYIHHQRLHQPSPPPRGTSKLSPQLVNKISLRESLNQGHSSQHEGPFQHGGVPDEMV